MKPTLSSKSVDLMRQVIEGMEDDEASLVSRLVESAFVDGASWTLASIKGDVSDPPDRIAPADGEKIDRAAGTGFGGLWLDLLNRFRLDRLAG